MNLEQTLTKENFFNEMGEKFPKSMKKFCSWIDEYKKEIGWNGLFNDHYHQSNIQRAGNGEISHIDYSAPKYHDLPYAMQYGIWIQYCRLELSNYFEQPEHISDSVDLEEDIKGVFASMESLIEEDE
jgi:hypothetical protein